LDGLSVEQCKESTKSFIKNNLRGEVFNCFDGNQISIATKNVELHKLDRPGKAMRSDKYRLRQLAIIHMDELIEASHFDCFEKDYKKKHGDDVEGFEKRKAEFEVCEQTIYEKPYIQIYDIELTICCRSGHKTVYDISRINKKDTYSVLLRHRGRLMEFDKVSFDKTIASIPGFVKTNPAPISHYQQENIKKKMPEKQKGTTIVTDNSPKVNPDQKKNNVQGEGESQKKIIKELKKHSLFPNKNIVGKIERLNQVTGRYNSLEDICTAYKQQANSGTETGKLVQEIGNHLKEQQIQAMQREP